MSPYGIRFAAWRVVILTRNELQRFATNCNDFSIFFQKILCYIYNGQSDEENKNLSAESISFAKE